MTSFVPQHWSDRITQRRGSFRRLWDAITDRVVGPPHQPWRERVRFRSLTFAHWVFEVPFPIVEPREVDWNPPSCVDIHCFDGAIVRAQVDDGQTTPRGRYRRGPTVVCALSVNEEMKAHVVENELGSHRFLTFHPARGPGRLVSPTFDYEINSLPW